MRFLLAVLFLAALTAPASSQSKRNPHVANTPPLTPEEQLKRFKLPPGFAIQLVAAEPKIKKPINIAFDAMGRLWVTGSEEYPFPAPDSRPGKDTVKILSDFAPNGLAQKVGTFADGLNIPIGVLPVKGGALVYSIPNIYFMTEKDGVAVDKKVLYSGYGFKDTHGMTGEFVRGFDGWVYCCHGFANTSNIKGDGGKLSLTSGNTYRIKIDGSKIEQFTFGQVNPFGLCFDSWGNLYSSDCHTRPMYQLLKGAHYPSFGKPHDGLGFGPEMVTHDHGSTAIAGICCTADDTWPKEYRDNLFVGNVVTNRINRDRIEWHGSTPKGIEMPDFVKCDDPWFRPVDIKLGPDGAMYVADFYNRIIGHYEIDLKHPGRDRERGRIWRIVPVDEKGEAKLHAVKDVATFTVDELVKSLDHPNLTVRLNATQEVVSRGHSTLGESDRKNLSRLMTAALTSDSERQRSHAVCAISQLPVVGDGEKGYFLMEALFMKNPSGLVHTHLLRVMSEWKQWPTDFELIALNGLRDKSANVRRAAAQALGSQPDIFNVEPLLTLRREIPKDDTHLLHVVRMALRDHFRDEKTAKAIVEKTWTEQQTADLADVCPGARTPLASYFLAKSLAKTPAEIVGKKEYVHAIVRFGSEKDRDAVIAGVRTKFAKDAAAQAGLLKIIQQGLQERGEKLGAAEIKLAEEIVPPLLNSKNTNHVQDAIELAQAARLTSTLDPLLAVVRAPKASPKLRAAAVVAVVAIDPAKSQGPLAALLVDDKEDLAVREQIAQALAGTNQATAHETLTQALGKAPARLQSTIALGMAGSPQGGEKLLDAVAVGKASPRLLQDRGVVLKLQQAKIAKLDDRLATLTKGLPAADQKLDQLLKARRTAFTKGKWDPAAGQAVFQKNCAVCHQIANQGAKIGPQLDGIGIRGVERLLEDILDPSRNVDQAFRSTSLELDNGQFLTGLLLREDGEVLVMADAQGKEVRIQKANVTNRSVGPLSPMPANFWEQIPEEDFYKLMAFLMEQRPKN